MQDVVCTTNARSDLGTETQGDAGESGCIGREIFFVEADAGIDTKTGVTDRPIVLNVEGMLFAADLTDYVDTVLDLEVSVVATASLGRVVDTPLRLICSNDGIAARGAIYDGVSLTIVDVYESVVVERLDVVAEGCKLITRLEVVNTVPSGVNVGDIRGKLLAGICIVGGGQVSRDVVEPAALLEGGRNGRAALRGCGGCSRVSVKVAQAGGYAASL